MRKINLEGYVGREVAGLVAGGKENIRWPEKEEKEVRVVEVVERR